MTIQQIQRPISAGFSPPNIESFFDDADAWVVKTLYGMKAEMFISDRCPFSVQDAVLFRSACRLLQSMRGKQYKIRVTKAITALKTAKADFHFDHAVNTIARVIHPAASRTSLSRVMNDDDRGLLLRAIKQMRIQVLELSQRNTPVMLLAGVVPLYRAFIARLTSVLRIPALLSLLPAGRVLLHSSGIAMYCNPFEFLVALAFDTTAIVVTSPSERALWHADQIGTAGTQNNMPAPSLGSSEPADWLAAPCEQLIVIAQGAWPPPLRLRSNASAAGKSDQSRASSAASAYRAKLTRLSGVRQALQMPQHKVLPSIKPHQPIQLLPSLQQSGANAHASPVPTDSDRAQHRLMFAAKQTTCTFDEYWSVLHPARPVPTEADRLLHGQLLLGGVTTCTFDKFWAAQHPGSFNVGSPLVLPRASPAVVSLPLAGASPSVGGVGDGLSDTIATFAGGVLVEVTTKRSQFTLLSVVAQNWETPIVCKGSGHELHPDQIMELMDGVLYDDNASHGNDVIYVDMSSKSAKKQGQWIQVLSVSALHRLNNESTAYVHSVCLEQKTTMRDPNADRQMKADAVTVYNRYAGLLAKFHEWWALMVQLYSDSSKQHQKESLVIQHHILYRYINWTLRYWTKFGRFVCELNPSLVALCKGEAFMTNPCKDYPTPERQWKDVGGLFQV